MRSRTFSSEAWILAPLLVACATFVGVESLAEVAGGDEAETVTESAAPSARPPIAGLDAILTRISGGSRATAGRGSRVADTENSLIHSATDETSEHDLRLRRTILGHEAVIHATIREVAPGATIVPTSFDDGEEDVVRHARETGADMVVMAFGKPTRIKKEEEAEEETSPDGYSLMRSPDFRASQFWPRETPESLYLYAKALLEKPDTLFVISIGNEGLAMTMHDLPWHVSAIPNGVAAVWVDDDERIHPLSQRCGPAWRTHMCIAVSGSMLLTGGAGRPYKEDGTVVHGTSVAAARLAAGLAVLRQWLHEAEGRDVSAEALLQIACNTARLGPNTHEEVGCGILDLDTASRGHVWAESTRLVSPTLEPPPSRLDDENRFLSDGSIAIEGEAFDTLNPFGEGRAAAGALMVYDGLTFRTVDGDRGLIAESVVVNEEERWIEFVIRDEARFHDGAQITTQDVIWTVETLMASGPHGLVDYLIEDVERAVETGPRTVRIILDSIRPNSPIDVARIGGLPVLPRHFWEGREFREPIVDPPLGSGRYRIAAVEPGRSVTYELVEDYWAHDLEFHGDYPFVERITYRYISPGADRAEGNRENGRVDDENSN